MYNSLNVPVNYAGYISMIISAGTVLSSIFSEKIIKRFGTGVVTAVSVFMTAAALIGFSFSNAFVALCFYAIPLGLGAGSIDAALNNYVALHYKAKHMSWLHCFWGIGASTGPIIMSLFLVSRNSWNLGYRSIGVIQLCLVVILFGALPLWKKVKSRNMEEQQKQNRDIKFLQLFGIPGVKQVLAAFFCYCSIELTAGLWGSSYFVLVKNISPETAARWISLYYIGITFGRFISGFLTMKFNNRQMIRLGQAIIACGIVVFILPVGTMLLLPGFFMMGLGCAPIYPSFIHQTPESFGSKYSQAIIGIQMASAYIGSTFMPPLFGKIASYLGFGLFPLFIGLVLAAMIILTEIMNRKVDNAKAPLQCSG
jgi:fucose permease